MINIQFVRKVDLVKVCFYVDFATDESSTPKKITIRAGACLHSLVNISVVDLHEPMGWVSVAVRALDELNPSSEEKDEDEQGGKPLRCFFLQLKITSMHQNGRDTHLRQVKVFGRKRNNSFQEGNLLNSLSGKSGLKSNIPHSFSVDMTQFSGLR